MADNDSVDAYKKIWWLLGKPVLGVIKTLDETGFRDRIKSEILEEIKERIKSEILEEIKERIKSEILEEINQSLDKIFKPPQHPQLSKESK